MAQDVATSTWVIDELQPVYNTTGAWRMPVQLKKSATFAAGTVLGMITSAGSNQYRYGAYASGNSDGTQYAECIISRACATDSSGNITLGSASGGGEFGETWDTVPAYFGGTFLAADLTGLDSNALGSKLYGRLLKNSSVLTF